MRTGQCPFIQCAMRVKHTLWPYQTLIDKHVLPCNSFEIPWQRKSLRATCCRGYSTVPNATIKYISNADTFIGRQTFFMCDIDVHTHWAFYTFFSFNKEIISFQQFFTVTDILLTMQSKYMYMTGAIVAALSMVVLSLQRKFHWLYSVQSFIGFGLIDSISLLI